MGAWVHKEVLCAVYYTKGLKYLIAELFKPAGLVEPLRLL